MNVPQILPEESIHGFVSRIAGANLLEGDRRRSKKLFGRPWRNTNAMVPSPFAYFHEKVGKHIGELGQLLTEHTLYPYFLPVLGPKHAERFRRRVLHGSTGPLLPRRQPLSLWPTPPVTRRCLSCEREAITKFGIAYSKRIHTAPFVTRCSVHNEYLLRSVEPQIVASISLRWHSDRSAEQTANSFDFSLASQQLTINGRSFIHPLKHYGAILGDLGFYTGQKRFRKQHLVAEVCSHYKDGFEDAALTLLATSCHRVHRWISEMFSDRSAIHPVHLLLLEQFLKGQTVRQSCFPYQIPQVIKARIDEEALVTQIREHATLTEVSEKLGISVTTLATVAKKHDIQKKYRPKVLKKPLEEQILQSLEQGLDIPYIMRNHSVSSSLVYRALRINPESGAKRTAALRELKQKGHRALWLGELQKHPKTGATKLRMLAPRTWTWLYRHDPQWLRQNSPRSKEYTTKRPRIASNTEEMYAVQFASTTASTKLMTSNGKPVYVSETKVFATAGLSDQAVSRLRELSANSPIKLGETRGEFVKRRIQWAQHKLNREADAATWKVQRESGLRTTTTARFLAEGWTDEHS